MPRSRGEQTDEGALGDVFTDAEVAERYRYRAPYPDAVFAILRDLIVHPLSALDAGAGTGAIARGMVRFAERIDAVDPSGAMVGAGRLLPNGSDPAIRWIVGRAEDAPLWPPYGLITCGASLHWMDLEVVMPRFRGVLAANAFLAIVDVELLHGAYRDDVRQVIREHSEVEHHSETKDLIEQLQRSGRFALDGLRRTEPVPFEQSVDEYIEMLHSTSTLARARLKERSAQFDAQIRRVFERHELDRVRYGVVGLVAWGRPL